MRVEKSSGEGVGTGRVGGKVGRRCDESSESETDASRVGEN